MISNENIDSKCIDKSYFVPIYNTAPGFPKWFLDLTEKEIATLKKNIESVIRVSYKHGGATIKSFYGADGSEGSYSSRFLVYNQQKDPYDNAVVKTKTPDGRTTHWVPEVQK